ncbi:lysophospholipid acyltransferase family protein [Lihuaxuella thermophila]|uniref:1-acyl-sn-glycerol-3-phosphate acyltransferase n=1 Tax=Lihuaxuella thermophila TaxID=1173111 RepID=A0A1H8BLF3_9BACL|nr:lysophospholipid acyltransferase family protein [Lihuaxuella thermophila]SEM82974.1 1-acyl-sn-glycerol-3-phosphate acyltransferase [Lihuaxuella thermophila]
MIYSLAKGIVRAFLYLYHRIQANGMKKIPAAGPVIVVGNHVSYLDPVYIGAMLPRRIHFMAKQEIFRNAVMRCLLNIAGAFPVNRDKPQIQTMRTALHYLQNGEVVGIFPEGGRRQGNTFDELKQGAAYLAVKSNCPVVPVCIEGTEQALPRGSVWIRPVSVRMEVGQILYPPATGSVKEKQLWLTEQIQREFIRLKSTPASSRTVEFLR